MSQPLRLYATRQAATTRCIARSFTSSASCSIREKPEESSADSSSPKRKPENTGSGLQTGVTFEAWLSKIGGGFKDPTPGRTNWLGITCVSSAPGHCPECVAHDHMLPLQPFPMNPSFKPRPPISDAQRQTIFDAHAAHPELNSVRALSEHFGISLKRVEAIIRLKALEFKWKQVGVAQALPRLCPLPFEDEFHNRLVLRRAHGSIED